MKKVEVLEVLWLLFQSRWFKNLPDLLLEHLKNFLNLAIIQKNIVKHAEVNQRLEPQKVCTSKKKGGGEISSHSSIFPVIAVSKVGNGKDPINHLAIGVLSCDGQTMKKASADALLNGLSIALISTNVQEILILGGLYDHIIWKPQTSLRQTIRTTPKVERLHE